jgi:NifU-like protein
MMCELVKGKTLDEAYKLSNQDIVNGLGKVPSVKVHCSIIGTRSLRAAIDKYRGNFMGGDLEED